MVTHRSTAIALLSIVVLPFALLAACDKVPLLAPTGSIITILPATTTVSLNSEVTIVATVIENGQAVGGTGGTVAARPGIGTPVQNGTLVSFTTTIGRIEPFEARTHNGQVNVRLVTSGASGTATITAYSGGASATKELKVGTAAVKTVTVTTTPQALGVNGGTAQVSAFVTDEGGNSLGGVPVTFATDKGSVSPSTATTDSSGVATATLTTNATAKVTATVGAITSTAATVTVNARGLASITASPTSANAGTTITFTVTPTTGANLSNVRINFGDGSDRDLGAITGVATVPYSYSAPGNYTVTATSTDSFGDAGSVSTGVIIGSLPVTLTANPATTTVGSSVTFTVGGVTSAQVRQYLWTFDDGTPQQTTTSPQNIHTFQSKGPKNVRVDVIGINGGVIGSAPAVVQVN
jgi:hypothetical protein